MSTIARLKSTDKLQNKRSSEQSKTMDKQTETKTIREQLVDANLKLAEEIRKRERLKPSTFGMLSTTEIEQCDRNINALRSHIEQLKTQI